MITFQIDHLLKARGWTQYRLEQQSGVRRDIIAKYASSQVRRPDLGVLNSLCAALECGIGDLMEYVPDPPAAKPRAAKSPRAKKR